MTRAGGPKDMTENKPPPPSFIQQLLRELSYDGAAISRYRNGGLGMENVLTAEVLQGINFLPREYFFKTFVERLNGEIGQTRDTLLVEAENASFEFLPGAFPFRLVNNAGQNYTVNPDGILKTPSVYAFVEAKRIKSSSFQQEQLAREFVVVVRETGRRTPLLLLMVGKEPTFGGAGRGTQGIAATINSTLAGALEKIDSSLTRDELAALVETSVAWITWQTISDLLREQTAVFRTRSGASDSTCKAVERIVLSVTDAIKSAGKRRRPTRATSLRATDSK